MKKIINGWKHYPGVHCGSVAIRDVAKYYGFEFSESMCFGLGGGLGFYYSINDEMSPSRSIHVRGPGMEINFFNLFGLTVSDWKYEEDNEKAFDDLKAFIDSDIPVLIQTDIYYLEYYNSSTHFPGHIVVVCGYDDEKEIFYLSDTGFDDLQVVSYTNLIKARSSKAKPYPLTNNWIETDLTNKKIDLEHVVTNSIVKNAKIMKEGFKTVRGESGLNVIKEWASDLPNWKSVEDWKWCARFSYQVISKRGVDGAGFRWMYRDFLNEVVHIIPLINSLGLIKKMDFIGSKWSEISKNLKEISEIDSPNNKFIETSHIANQIFALEQEFYSTVLNEF